MGRTHLGGSRLRAATFVAALVLALCAGLVDGSPAQAATPKPTGLKTNVSKSAVVLSWTPVRGATSYAVQVADNPGFDDPAMDGSTTNTQATPTAVLPFGKLYWRVLAVSAKGRSKWAAGSFSRSQQAGPIQLEPDDGVVLDQPEHPPVLRWAPVPGATSYEVEIDGEERDWVDTVTYDSQTPALVPLETQNPGTYWWRVRAYFAADVNSRPSAERAYTIGPLPHVTLRETAPTMENVVLQWDPVPGAVDYEIRVSTDNEFNVITDQRAVAGTRYSPPASYDNASYWWQVRARGINGQTEEWPVYPERTGEFKRTWPEKPVLIQPSDGAAPAGDLYFQWSPVPNAARYVLDVGTDPGFSNINVFKSCETHQTTYTPGWGRGTKPNADKCMPGLSGTYYWRVRALDGAGRTPINGRFSDVRSFVYAAPAAPSGTLAGATGQRVTLDGNGSSPCAKSLGTSGATCLGLMSTPMLDWDPAPGARYYLIYLAHDRDLTNMVDGYGDIGNPSTLYSTTNTRFAPMAALPDTQAGEAYYWFVRPCGPDNLCGLTPETGSNAFAKKSAEVELLSPANNATVADQVTFDWADYLATNQRSSDPATGERPTQAASGYRIQVAQNPSFTSTSRDELVYTNVVDQTTFTAFTDTYPEGVLYWRVQAIDGANNGLTWSPVRQFTKESPTPQVVSPTEGAVVNGVQPFRWEPLLYAKYYDLEVYRNNDTTASQANLALTGRNLRQSAATSPEPLQALGQDFVWRVRRTDYDEHKSAWSEWHRFRVTAAQPKLLTPGASVNRKRALFTWQQTPTAASYRWELRKGSDIVEQVTTVATAFAPTSELAGGAYTWRVVSFDNDRNVLRATGWRKVRAK